MLNYGSSIFAPLLCETMKLDRWHGVGQETFVCECPCRCGHLSISEHVRSARFPLQQWGEWGGGGGGVRVWGCGSSAVNRQRDTHAEVPPFNIHTPRHLFRDRPVHTHPNTDAGCQVHIQKIHTHKNTHILMRQTYIFPQKKNELVMHLPL